MVHGNELVRILTSAARRLMAPRNKKRADSGHEQYYDITNQEQQLANEATESMQECTALDVRYVHLMGCMDAVISMYV